MWALFNAKIRPGIDSYVVRNSHNPVPHTHAVIIHFHFHNFHRIPLAAGLFNREVYLKGMERRLKNKLACSSTVCSIQ